MNEKDRHQQEAWQTVEEALSKHLGAGQGSEFDIVDVLPIPRRGDRMVRVRALEEALNEFDEESDTSNGDETLSYLVQVKKRRNTAAKTSPLSTPDAFVTACAVARGEDPTSHRKVDSDKPSLDGIYLPNGKLNIPFLTANGEMLFASREYALARNIYRTILSSGECSALALYWLARCFEAENRPDEAIRHYEESLTYHPTLDGYRRLTNLLISAKKDQEAAELLEAALNLKDMEAADRLEIHKACGNCWMRAEKSDKAEGHYQRALEIDSRADSVQANLGALHLEAGRTPQAKRHFQEAIGINAKNDRALSGLGSCHLAEGDKRLAHDCFAKALQVNLNNPAAIYYLVKCAYEIKSYATAVTLVSSYIEIAPINVGLLHSLAGLQYHLGRMEDARETANRILSLQPQHAGALELIGTIARYTGS